MANLEISNGNIFISNNDESDINTKVTSLFIDNGYYLRNNIEIFQNYCNSIVLLSFVFNIVLANLTIESNRCAMNKEDYHTDGYTAGLLIDSMDGSLTTSNVTIKGNIRKSGV